MSNATISDVARKVGVSESTVSRFISGYKVRNAKRISRAIKELDYRPNIIARNLKTGKTGLIAVVVPDITNPFFAALVRGAELAAGDEYMIQLINTGDDLEREKWALKRMIGRVDGFIYVPLQENSDVISKKLIGSLPLVFVDRIFTNSKGFDSVLADNCQGGYIAASHLMDLGHKSIAFISGPLSSTPGRERAIGFNQALKENGIVQTPEYFIESDFSSLGGHQAMVSLLSLKSRPTAVFIANNLMTIGALKAMKEHRISVPEDMAVIGFDDHEISDLIDPPLTVISRDAHLQGAIAMATLLERIRGINQFPPKQIKVDVNLVVRKSCGSTCHHRSNEETKFEDTFNALTLT